MDRKWKLLTLVVLAVAIAGCADVHTELTIDSQGEIHEYKVDVEFHDETWEMLEWFADMEGYDNVGEYLLEEEEEEEEFEEDYVDCAEGEEVSVDEDAQRVTFICSAPTVVDETAISIELSDDGETVTYRDSGMVDEFAMEEEDEFDDGFEDDFDMDIEMEVTHTVVMPGEITDSNADEIDGQRATWDVQEFDGNELFAESGTEAGVPDDDDGFAPGFGIGAGLLAVLLVVAFFVRRR